MANVETTGTDITRGHRKWIIMALLVGLFVVSVFIRLPNLNRPLAGNHEWITAHTLIVLNLWHDFGMKKFYYSPIITWQEPGDKGIGWENYLLVQDGWGNYYHASYPPLGYYAPYAVFKILGVAPNPLGLELFNVALCGLSAFLIFWVVKRLYRAEPDTAQVAAAWAVACYLFNPATLWFQCNTYFVDMLMQPLFILTILCSAELLQTDALARNKWWWLAAVALALTAFTEWIALFCYVTLVGLFFLRKQWRTHWLGLLALGAAMSGAFVAVVAILARMKGWHDAVDFMLAKYLQKKSAHADAYDTLKMVYHFGRSYLYYFGGLFLLIASLFLVWWRKQPARPLCSRAETNLLVLSGAPVLMHHFVLFGFTIGNDYSVLKAAPFLCFLSAMLCKRLWESGLAPGRRALVILWLAFAVLSTGMYYHDYNPGLKDPSMLNLGHKLAQLAGPDDVLCLRTPAACVEPQISYYARRSILYYESDRQVEKHLKDEGLKRAVIVTVDDKNAIHDIRWLQADAPK